MIDRHLTKITKEVKMDLSLLKTPLRSKRKQKNLDVIIKNFSPVDFKLSAQYQELIMWIIIYYHQIIYYQFAGVHR